MVWLMTIGSEAVRVVSAGYFIPRPRLSLIARTMREDDPALFPRDPVGRNMGTRLLPPHLTNLMFGAGIGDPIAKVAEQVRAYRLAGYYTPIPVVLDETKGSPPILGRQGLGRDFDSIIDCLGRGGEAAEELRHALGDRFMVTMTVGEIAPALVEITPLPDADANTPHQIDIYYPYRPSEECPPLTYQYQGKDYPLAMLQRVVRFNLAHFELMGLLWADSLKHGAVYNPSPLDPSGMWANSIKKNVAPKSSPVDSSGAKPEAEAAASGPARDQNATVVSNQTASAEPGRASQAYPIRTRRHAQGVEGSGCSPYSLRSHHDRTDEHAAAPGS